VEEQSITDIDENVTSLAGMPALHSPPPVNSKSKHTQVYESKLDEKWDTRFMELEKYQEKNGHCNCPQKNGSLGKWIMTQRNLFTSKTLKEDRYEKLVGIGFIFESNNVKWNTRFVELEKYKEKNGHCNCPQKNGSLGGWVSKQRNLFTSKKLKADHYEKLVGIGFVFEYARFESDNVKWNTRFMELVEYKETNGHCNIRPEKGSLGGWVSKQRNLFKSKKLKADRHEKLVGIGFTFVYESNLWNTQFMELVKYKEKNGHCNIPTTNASLGKWISTQRTLFTSEKLKADRYEKLVGIGFVFEYARFAMENEKWNTQFVELVEYNETNGHCNIPTTNASLGKWISTQRTLFTSEKLKADRYEKLVGIGFAFEGVKNGPIM
jgi:hypothetical protein